MKAALPDPVFGKEYLPESIFRAVETVFHQAQETGAPPVEAVVIEDREGQWKNLLLGLPPGTRMRSVIVYESASAVDLAGRLGVGGALPFPPSTLRAVTASRAAERRWKIPLLDPVGLEEMRASRWLELRLQPDAVWKRVFGLRAMVELFWDLAASLSRAPVIDCSSMMLPAGMKEEEIRAAWAGLETKPPWAREEMLEIAGESGDPVDSFSGGRLARLPEGDFPGRWKLVFSGEDSRWELEGLELSVADGLVPSDRKAAEMIRLPSWLHLDLAWPGSPGRELLDLWNRETETAQLWIPNLRPDGLPAVLALGRSILVDGPVVPTG